MEDTDSDILGLGFLITSSIMWISNRGHVFCVRGIRLHPTVVFSNVLMKKKRQSNRKTSEWSKSDCSVRGRYQQRYLVYYKRYRKWIFAERHMEWDCIFRRDWMCWCKTSDMRIEKHMICQKVIVRYMEDTDSDILGLGFLITSSIMWISNRGHVFCVRGIRLHPTGVFSNVLMKRSDRVIEKHLIGQKVIVPYVEDTNSDILFTIKGIEMNFCRDAYGVRLYLPTRFEPGVARNTEVIADRTIWDKWTDGNY